MKKIIHDKTFIPFLSSEEIQQKVKAIAEQINEDYAGKSPLFIAILNGSFMFASDLFKQLNINAEISIAADNKAPLIKGLRCESFFFIPKASLENEIPISVPARK